jgi:hypothetical protein
LPPVIVGFVADRSKAVNAFGPPEMVRSAQPTTGSADAVIGALLVPLPLPVVSVLASVGRAAGVWAAGVWAAAWEVTTGRRVEATAAFRYGLPRCLKCPSRLHSTGLSAKQDVGTRVR